MTWRPKQQRPSVMRSTRIPLRPRCKMFDKAQTTGEQAASIAERVGNRELEVKAAWALDDITQGNRLRPKSDYRNSKRDRAAELEKQRAAQQRIVDGIREQIKVVLDNSKIFTKEGAIAPGR